MSKELTKEVRANTVLMTQLGIHMRLYYYVRSLDHNGSGWASFDILEVSKFFNKSVSTVRLWLRKCLQPIRSNLSLSVPVFRSMQRVKTIYRVFYNSVVKLIAASNYYDSEASFGYNALIEEKDILDLKNVGTHVAYVGSQLTTKYMAAKSLSSRDKKLKTSKMHSAATLVPTSQICQNQGVIGNTKNSLFIKASIQGIDVQKSNDYATVYGTSQDAVASKLNVCRQTVKNRMKDVNKKRQYITNERIVEEYISLFNDLVPSIGRFIIVDNIVYKKYTYLLDDSLFKLSSMKSIKKEYKHYLNNNSNISILNSLNISNSQTVSNF